MYYNFQVHRTNVKSFLRTAEVLQVKGLADHPLLLEAASYQKSNSVSYFSYYNTYIFNF